LHLTAGFGALHRFAVNGKSQDRAGWYVLFVNGQFLAGPFGDWRSGQNLTWSEKSVSKMSHAERNAYRKAMEHARKMRDEARRYEQKKAQKRAISIWEKAHPAGDYHPYPIIKGSYVTRISLILAISVSLLLVLPCTTYVVM
jgi:putative DNA primase/helicase